MLLHMMKKWLDHAVSEHLKYRLLTEAVQLKQVARSSKITNDKHLQHFYTSFMFWQAFPILKSNQIR